MMRSVWRIIFMKIRMKKMKRDKKNLLDNESKEEKKMLLLK